MYRDFPGFDDWHGCLSDRDDRTDSAPEPAAVAPIGKIQLTAGVVTIGRADADRHGAQPAAGDFIYEGDVIETGADGLIAIVFIDGTTFHLYANSHVVLDRFNFGADVSSHVARLRASKGKFGLMAGQIAAAGRFAVETPLSKIRSVPPAAGVASLGFMFLLCLIDDLKASSESETLWLVDGGTITYKDFEHGVFELITKDGQRIIVDDPGQTIILRPTGSGVGVEHISNDRAQIVALEDVYQRAYATFVQGLQDPFLQRLIKTSSEAGSSTLFPNGYNPFPGIDASLFPQIYTPPPTNGATFINNTIVLPPVVPGGVTVGATFTARLPVNNAQTAPVYLGPSNGSHTDNIFLNLTVPSNEVLTTVTISGLPAGETMTSGTGNVYNGGGSITIAGVDFISGLTLSNFSNTAAVLTIVATVFGAGGARLTVTTLALTIDAPIVAQPEAVHWTGPSGGDWDVAANWSTGVVPIPHQDVFLDKVGTVVSSGTVNISSLAVSAGVTLNITGGSFSIPTSAAGKPLANAGIISIGSGATMTVGDAAHAGDVVNTNTVQVSGGTLTLVNVAVDNTGAAIQVDAASVLNLEGASISNGGLTNSGSVVSTGDSALTGVTVTNGDLLEVASGTLTIRNGSFANTGGTLKIDAGATVELDGVTVSGGTITDNGVIHVTGSSTIDGGASLNNGTVNVDDGVTLTLDNITITGTVIKPGASTIAATGAFSVQVDASTLADNAQLVLTGSADFTVTGLKGDLDASAVTGTLDVTAVDVAGLTVATGSGGNTIDATALTNDHVLTMTGSHAATVGLKAGDLDASGHTGFGLLTVNVLANGSNSDTVSVATGSTAATITAADAGDTVTVHAAVLGDNSLLTLSGAADFVVDSLVGDLDASAVTGTLTVVTGDVPGNTIAITTGSAATSITANGTGDAVAVTATALADNTQLTLTGSAAVTVSGIKGDLDASALTGALSVTTGDAPDNAIAITTGSAATSITANGAGDTVTVTATALAENTQLTLAGGANVIVDGLVGDIVATGLTGTLTVTAGDASDNLIAVTSGAGATSITANGVGDTVSVTANALDESKLLTVVGSAKFIVGGLTADLDASALTGTLTVTVNNSGDNAVAIATGSAASTVTGTSPGDVITIDAALLADDVLLTLSGVANFVVTGLVGDIDASALTGDLTVTTGAVAGLTIATGTGANIIHAEALTAYQVLTLLGTAAATVFLNAGDLTANAYTGNITVTGGAGTNTITTGTGDDTATLAGAETAGVIDLGAGTDSLTLADGDNRVTASHVETIIGGNGADIVTLGAAQTSGTIDLGAGIDRLTLAVGTNTLTVSNVETINGDSGDDAITLATAQVGGTISLFAGADSLTLADGTNTLTVNNTETIDATALTAGNVFTLSGGGSGTTTVTLTAGDLAAGAYTGDLEVVAGSADNTIATGTGADIITGGGGNDIIDGGGGADTAIYSGASTDYAATISGGVITIIDLRANSPDGTDTVSNVGNFQFTDGPFAAIEVGAFTHHAPAGADKTVTTDEDTAYTFTVADFGFSDPDDSPGDVLTGVKIATLPVAGTLTNNGVAVAAGDVVTAAAIGSGLLVFTPAADANGAGYATFTFQVQDDGGTAHAGADLDASANTITVDVTAVNDAPAATITPATYSATEQTGLTLKGTGLAISDIDAGAGAMTVTLSVTEGTLNATAGDSGATVSGDGSSSLTVTGTVAQINNLLGATGTSTLSYIDNTDAPSASATLTLSVNDNGNAGGGNLSASDTATIDIAAVNDAPTPHDDANPGTFTEDTDTVIAVSTLLANDTDPDGDALTITAVGNSANSGTVTLNGSTITYHPNANYNGFDWFVYTVSDGQTTAQAAATFTVGAVNDAPVLSNVAVTNSSIAFDIADVDNTAFVLAGAFAAAFSSPALALGANSITPSEQASAVSGTLQVSDGAGGLADVIGLYLGSSGSDTTSAPLAGLPNVMYGFGGDDALTGGTGADYIYGDAGNDTIVGAQNDIVLDGGADTDTLQIGANFADVSDAQIVNIENVTLTAAGTTLNLSNQTEGFTIAGSSGIDTITGGAGADTIDGGDGNDAITGGGGANHLTGGMGADTFIFASPGDLAGDTIDGTAESGTTDVIKLTVGGTYDMGTAIISNIDNVVLTDAAGGYNVTVNDAMVSTASYNDVASRLHFGSGGSTVTGDITIDASGLTGTNSVFVNGGGYSGNDTLAGGAGDDLITGGAGNDIITGGGGDDRLTGNAGVDTFVFHADFGNDTITDFTAGTDILQFDSAVFADAAALLAATTDNGSGFAVIAYDANNTITLDNVNKATLQAQAGDLHFV